MGSDLIIAALGPFWSNSGARTWSMLFGADRIIAVPYTLFESLQLALRSPFEVWRGVRTGTSQGQVCIFVI